MPDRSAPVPHLERYGNGNPKLTGAHLDGELDGATAYASPELHAEPVGV